MPLQIAGPWRGARPLPGRALGRTSSLARFGAGQRPGATCSRTSQPARATLPRPTKLTCLASSEPFETAALRPMPYVPAPRGDGRGTVRDTGWPAWCPSPSSRRSLAPPAGLGGHRLRSRLFTHPRGRRDMPASLRELARARGRRRRGRAGRRRCRAARPSSRVSLRLSRARPPRRLASQALCRRRRARRRSDRRARLPGAFAGTPTTASQRVCARVCVLQPPPPPRRSHRSVL